MKFSFIFKKCNVKPRISVQYIKGGCAGIIIQHCCLSEWDVTFPHTRKPWSIGFGTEKYSRNNQYKRGSLIWDYSVDFTHMV